MRSLAELGFRLRQEAANVVLRAFPPSPDVADVPSPLPGLPDPAAVVSAIRGSPWAEDLTALAEQILAGRVPLLGTCIETGLEPAWRRDYIGGMETLPVYFRRISYLDATRVGDHKNIWELSRHQHLVLVAQAFALTNDPRFSRFVTGQIQHWWRENPFQCGINWTSSLEVAFRALSWIWIFHLLRREMDAAFRKELLTQLYRHGLHLEYNLSLYFSPNTHLLGEAVALHAIGCLFPQFTRSARWSRTGRSILLEQLRKQIHTDGGHFEQSTYYHIYALDMFLFHHSIEPLLEVGRLGAMAEFLTAIIGADGTVPFIGDDDGGRLFHPFGPRKGFARATLATSSVLLGREYYCYSDRDLLEQAIWWIGPRVRTVRRTPSTASSKCFSQSGIVTMRSDDIRVLVKAGPFGPWGAGHSHSDILSLVASSGETRILIDPGTYTYVGDPVSRDYFRGSAAHNTIRVNARNQAELGGPFRWRNKPDAQILSWETSPELDKLEAMCHYAGIRHRRQVWFRKLERLLTVTDVIEGEEPECLIEQFWHAGAIVTRIDLSRWNIGGRADLTVDPNASCELLEGWQSDAFASRHSAPVVRVWVRATIPLQLTTTIHITRSSEAKCPISSAILPSSGKNSQAINQYPSGEPLFRLLRRAGRGECRSQEAAAVRSASHLSGSRSASNFFGCPPILWNTSRK